MLKSPGAFGKGACQRMPGCPTRCAQQAAPCPSHMPAAAAAAQGCVEPGRGRVEVGSPRMPGDVAVTVPRGCNASGSPAPPLRPGAVPVCWYQGLCQASLARFSPVPLGSRGTDCGTYGGPCLGTGSRSGSAGASPLPSQNQLCAPGMEPGRGKGVSDQTLLGCLASNTAAALEDGAHLTSFPPCRNRGGELEVCWGHCQVPSTSQRCRSIASHKMCNIPPQEVSQMSPSAEPGAKDNCYHFGNPFGFSGAAPRGHTCRSLAGAQLQGYFGARAAGPPPAPAPLPVGRVRPRAWRRFRRCFPANLGSSLLASRPGPEGGQR